MKAPSPPHASSDPLRALGPVRFLVLGGIMALTVLLIPHAAFADPHAVFYTTKGQNQVYYNVLAALNGADYVEPPSTPQLTKSLEQLGTKIKTASGEQERVELPRIRVRQVTPDDGDVYYRMELWRRAEEKTAKVAIAQSTCAVLRILLGEQATEQGCPKPGGVTGAGARVGGTPGAGARVR